MTDGFPVKVGNQVYMISEKGYKIAQPEDFYEELGILSGSRIVARKMENMVIWIKIWKRRQILSGMMQPISPIKLLLSKAMISGR